MSQKLADGGASVGDRDWANTVSSNTGLNNQCDSVAKNGLD
ncbi:hypothetical protein ACSYAD_12825 [Acaryochloris marina NIES-2412]